MRLPSFLRWAAGILMGIVIILTIFQIVFMIWGNQYVGAYLKQKVRTQSDSLYTLHYDALNINWFTQSIHFDGFSLTADTTRFNQKKPSNKKSLIAHLTIHHFSINDIGVGSLLLGNHLRIGSIVLDRPNISLITAEKSQKHHQKKQESSFSSIDSSLYAALSPQFSSFRLGRFTIKKGSFTLRHFSAQQKPVAVANGVDIVLKKIKVNSSTAHSNRLFVTDHVKLNMQSCKYQPPNGFYTFHIQQVQVSSAKHRMSADSLQLIPRYPKHVFSRKKGVQTDRITLHIAHILLNKVNIAQAINKGRFYAQRAIIKNGRLEDYHDKTMPSPNHLVKLPNIVFEHLSTKIKIDTLSIRNSYISYAEQKPGIDRPGKVSFQNFQATFSGISNYKKALQKHKTTHLAVRTNVMGKGLLNVHVDFPMGYDDGRHTLRGSLGPMDASALNAMTVYDSFLKIKSGLIHSIHFDLKPNKYGTNGWVKADYEDLKITVMKKGNPRKNKKKLVSFLANTLVINTNHNGDNAGKHEINFERTEQKSIFNLWWKSLLSGLKGTIKHF